MLRGASVAMVQAAEDGRGLEFASIAGQPLMRTVRNASDFAVGRVLVNHWLLLVLVALMTATCGSAVSEIVIAERVSFQVPVSIKVDQRSPVEDFVLAQFSEGGDQLLGVYVGNFPSFPGAECTGERDDVSINGYAAEVAMGKKESTCLKEVLIDLGWGHDWPRFVHARFERVSQSQLNEAESIISSIRLVE